MDVNGLRFWQAADAEAFAIGGAAENLQWHAESAMLRLDRQQDAPVLAEDKNFARSQASKPSPVSDAGGSFAFWDGNAGAVQAGGFAPGVAPLPIPPSVSAGNPVPTDLAFGDDDVLYVARNGSVTMVDRRARWAPAEVRLGGFEAHRLAPLPGGGAWALDRSNGKIAYLTGHPLRVSGITDDDERFGPVDPNPDPPRLRRVRQATVPGEVEPIAIAGSQAGRLAVLGWRTGEDAVLFTLEDRKLVRRFALEGVKFPYALAWIGEDRVAVITSDGTAAARQAFVYELDTQPGADSVARPTGEVFSLFAPWPGNFCNRLAPTPVYPVTGDDATAPAGIRRLLALSRPTYARQGEVTIGPFDSGRAGTIWHRLFIETSIPEHCGIRLWAHADDGGAEPPPPGAVHSPSWAPHVFGAASLDTYPQAAQGSWCDEPSELAFNPGLSACPQSPGKSGLFTALIQRADTKVRRVSGRWLWLHLELVGDGQGSPEIAAIRTYAERLSWRDRYLPGFYREPLGGPDGDAVGGATPHDFLDRFLGLFEGPLTQLEGKIADSWLLTDPGAAPDPALPWLGAWVGVDETRGEAAARLRERLRAAPWTAGLHGTLGGMNAALELATGGRVVIGGGVDMAGEIPRPGQLALATLGGNIVRTVVLGVTDPRADQPLAVLAGGAVSRGEIVVLEGWRLRRTFATILGADLADEDDPLTLGIATSGNSFVGDTLFLGDEAQREVLSLFSADLPQSAGDRAAVSAFFERLAHRVLILVRDTPRTNDRARLQDIADAEAPAHVETTLWPARQPLIVGAASLVGIDTFLLPEPRPKPVRVDGSVVGGGDQILGTGQLDMRADGPVTPPPVAVIDGPVEVLVGAPFLLSAARSHAARGRTIARHIWTWI